MRRIFIFFITLLLFLSASWPCGVLAQAVSAQSQSVSASVVQAGSISASFSVSANGDAQYSIPIDVPPGVRNVQPNLSLGYSSNQGNGRLGVGWNLQGISSLARCKAVPIYDSYYGSINYDSADRFCLDGQRIINVSGSYGAVNSVYKTAIETWRSIKASSDSCGSGPCSFTVTNSDGTVFLYGTSIDSRILAVGRPDVRVWALKQIQDLNGNTVVFSYSNDPLSGGGYGQYYVTRIDYTANADAGIVANRSVQMFYQTRPDVETRYQGGSEITTSYRLSHLQTWVGTQSVLDYRLTYDQSQASGRSEVQSVQVCSTADTSATCLSPTNFSWQGSVALQFTKSTLSTKITNSAGQQFVPGDYNSDGLGDILAFTPDSGTAYPLVTVYQSTGSDLMRCGSSTRLNNDSTTLLPADVNGDGRLDLVQIAMQGSKQVLMWYLGQTDGCTFRYAGTYDTQLTAAPTKVWAMDFNGDGRTDIVQSALSGTQLTITAFASTGSAFSRMVSNTISQGSNQVSLQPMDVNGDGMVDLVGIWSNGAGSTYQLSSYVSNGKGFTSEVRTALPGTSGAFYLPADINGDGNVDLVQCTTQANALLLTPLTADGVGGFKTGKGVSTGRAMANTLSIWPMDANGDGQTDLVQAYATSSGELRLALYLNTDGNFDSGTDLGVQLSADDFATTFPIDLQGDGRMSVLQGWVNGSSLYFSNYGTAQAALDRIASITNGLGNRTAITYLPMSNPQVYTRAADSDYPVLPAGGYGYRQAPGQYPFQAVSGGTLQLVSQYANSNAASASAASYSYQYSLTYAGASIGLDGTGWLGFNTVSRLNLQTGEQRIDTYNQTYPLTGTVVATQYFCVVNGISSPDPLCTGAKPTPLSAGSSSYQPVVTAWGATTPNPAVYLLQVSGVQYDAYTYGKYNNSRAETYKYDSYGQLTLRSNLGYVSAQGKDLTETDNVYTCSQYYVGNTTSGTPLLDFQTAIKVSSSSDCMNWSSFTAGVDFSLDKLTYTSAMQVEQHSAWDSANNVFLVTTSDYDTPGNLIKLIQPGGSTTTSTYDALYHTYVDTVISPPNANGVNLISYYGFDPRFGVLTGYADPNKLVTTTCVDDFGRTVGTQVTPPNFVAVTPDTNCLGAAMSSTSMPFGQAPVVTIETTAILSNAGGLYVNVQQLQDWDSGSTRNWRYFLRYYDGLGRNFQNVAQGPSSTGNTANYLLFDSGDHVIQQSLPYYIAGQEDVTAPTSQDARRWLYTTYDVYGRPTYSSVPAGPSGNEQAVTTVSYPDSDSAVVTEAAGDPYAIVKTLTYQYFNSNRRLTQMTVLDASNAVSTFGYDQLGRMISAIDPPTSANPQGVVNSMTYDSLDRRLTLNNPDQNTLASGLAAQWNYSPDTGLLVSVINAKGQVISYTYDQLYRVLTQNLAGQSLLQFTFDDPNVAYSLGKLTSVVKTDTLSQSTQFSYNYSFDTQGNRSSETLQLTGYPAYTKGTQFDPLRRLTQLSYPDQTLLQHIYQLGNLAQSNLQGTAYATYANYTPLGLPQNITYGNGASASYSYSPTGLINNSRILDALQQPLLDQTVSWDHLFHVKAIDDNLKETVDYSQAFTHQLHRLTAAKADGLYGSLQYSYDASGNLIGQNDVVYSYNAHRVIDGTADGVNVFVATYDANGNVQSKQNAAGQWQFSYDPLNRMQGATLNGAQMLTVPAIDQDGRRLIKIDNQDITSVYAFPPYTITNYPTGSVSTRYLPSAGGGPVGAVTVTLAGDPPTDPGSGYPTPGRLYYSSDYLSTTQITTGDDGRLVSRFAYTPYGTPIQTGTAGPDNVRPKFQGKELDSSTGLYYFDARYLDSVTGRFTSADTRLPSELQRIDALNRFAFALNDPITNRDSSGHDISARAIGMIVGSLEIAASVVVDIASEGALTPVSAALMGAGINGLSYSAQERKHFSWQHFGIQQGIGAAMGLFTPGMQLEEGVGRVALAEGAEMGASRSAYGARAAEGWAGGRMAEGGEIEMQSFNKDGAALESDDLMEGRVPTSHAAQLDEHAGEGEASCNSFVDGTLVWTRDGLRPIEDIRSGDTVWGQEAPERGAHAQGLYQVGKVFSHPVSQIVVLRVGNETIRVTPEHPFWVDGNGWVDAGQLRPGMRLAAADGSLPVVIEVNEATTALTTVRNFSVVNAKTYRISALGLLVHNPTCKLSRLPAPKSYKKSRAKMRAWGEKITGLVRHFGDEDIRYEQPARGRRKIDFIGYVFEKVNIPRNRQIGSRNDHFAYADRAAHVNHTQRYNFGTRQRPIWSNVVWHHSSFTRGEVHLVPRELHEGVGHVGWYSGSGR